MKKIIPVTDLQRQAGQIANDPSANKANKTEAALTRFDEAELQKMLSIAEDQIAVGQTISHKQVIDRMAQRLKATTK